MTYTNSGSPDRHPREKSLAASFPPAAGTLICVSQHFDTMPLPAARDAVAPDGSDVRVLLRLARGSMAHFELEAGRTSRAVTHRRVDEIWYVLSGRGQMWRRQAGRQQTVALEPGTCLSIPAGTHFQFRSSGPGPLAIVGVTMPPWPGDGEAREVPGAWPANASAPPANAPAPPPDGPR
jgi:mannose-6-phosphate isomerase-like protein (cupin superfamily)